ncbi:MAG: flagellar motor protein MotA [Lysobacterales bacterium]
MALKITRPHRALLWMAVFSAALTTLLIALREPLLNAFQANAAFNGVIVAVLAVGLLVTLKQVLALYQEARWIDEFRRKNPARKNREETRLLAPMARMLDRHDEGQFTLSAGSLRSLLDSIRSRLDDSRDISRYLVGLLIFLGLLGTFWGLLLTIGDVGRVIGGLNPEEGAGAAVFERLKAGLQGPLAGMAVAFSSSLFGLAGSLILGFFDLQAGHAQNRFFNDLEEWLSSVTRLSSGALPGDGEAGVPAYVQALLEQTADGLERMQRALGDQSTHRSELHHQLATLNRHMADMGQQMQKDGLSEDLRQELRLLNRTLAAALSQRAELEER